MSTRSKPVALQVISDHLQEQEANVSEAANVTGPMVQRLASHRDRIDVAIKELESERFELISRRDHLRRQAEAAEVGFAMHIDDIEATLRLYESGLNSVEAPKGT